MESTNKQFTVTSINPIEIYKDGEKTNGMISVHLMDENGNEYSVSGDLISKEESERSYRELLDKGLVSFETA